MTIKGFDFMFISIDATSVPFHPDSPLRCIRCQHSDGISLSDNSHGIDFSLIRSVDNWGSIDGRSARFCRDSPLRYIWSEQWDGVSLSDDCPLIRLFSPKEEKSKDTEILYPYQRQSAEWYSHAITE
ncbi:hypothetical protein RF11_04134 [Thelohanellus kitauei]|uniref:Uncharacterized protein n=1 Tax=Thelohanellus kitauei TaxID=669202 RepID=A0A0C2MVC3_THEKT|nr:hypothetical protein RF11_04134 [Thelohanellus kitauei]